MEKLGPTLVTEWQRWNWENRLGKLTTIQKPDLSADKIQHRNRSSKITTSWKPPLKLLEGPSQSLPCFCLHPGTRLIKWLEISTRNTYSPRGIVRLIVEWFLRRENNRWLGWKRDCKYHLPIKWQMALLGAPGLRAVTIEVSVTATRTPVHCSTLTIQYFSSEMPLSHKNVTAKYNNTKSRFSAVCYYRGVLLFWNTARFFLRFAWFLSSDVVHIWAVIKGVIFICLSRRFRRLWAVCCYRGVLYWIFLWVFHCHLVQLLYKYMSSNKISRFYWFVTQFSFELSIIELSPYLNPFSYSPNQFNLIKVKQCSFCHCWMHYNRDDRKWRW